MLWKSYIFISFRSDVVLITNIERDWIFETDVKYLRVLGGTRKREGMIKWSIYDIFR